MTAHRKLEYLGAERKGGSALWGHLAQPHCLQTAAHPLFPVATWRMVPVRIPLHLQFPSSNIQDHAAAWYPLHIYEKFRSNQIRVVTWGPWAVEHLIFE